MGERQILPVQMNPTCKLALYDLTEEGTMSDSPNVSSLDQPVPKPPAAWRVAAGVAIGLLLWFCFDNRGSVTVHFWVTSFRAPVIVVILVSAFLGALTVSLWRRSRRHH